MGTRYYGVVLWTKDSMTPVQAIATQIACVDALDLPPQRQPDSLCQSWPQFKSAMLSEFKTFYGALDIFTLHETIGRLHTARQY